MGWAALAFVGGTLLTEVPRIAKRWWLMTANARICANIRADAWRGVIAWPMARLDRTPAGEVMARISGDVAVLGVGVREFTIETWDTILFSLSLMVAMLVYDLPLTVLALPRYLSPCCSPRRQAVGSPAAPPPPGKPARP